MRRHCQFRVIAHHCVAVHPHAYRPVPLLHPYAIPTRTFSQNLRTSCGFHACSRFFFINARPMCSVYLRMHLLHVPSTGSSRFVNASRVWFHTIATDPHFEFLPQQARRRHVDRIAATTTVHHSITTACRRVFIGRYGKAAHMPRTRKNRTAARGQPFGKKLRNLLLHRR
jgi:hypothetical protein